MWFKINNIDNKDPNINKFIYNFVIKCPCTIKHTKALVSQRGDAFSKREIKNDLLNTLNAEIKKRFVKNVTYVKLKSNTKPENSVDNHRETLLNSKRFSDPNFEFFIFKKRTDMSDTETIYYCIRNAFAHGSFSIINDNNKKVYLMHCEKNKDTKADMRLKESTLKRLIELKNMNPSEIRDLRKKKTSKNKRSKHNK